MQNLAHSSHRVIQKYHIYFRNCFVERQLSLPHSLDYCKIESILDFPELTVVRFVEKIKNLIYVLIYLFYSTFALKKVNGTIIKVKIAKSMLAIYILSTTRPLHGSGVGLG